mmetsp:Transcript_58023/g.136270  ORF Transcript_58023/g.136270 Transcript_58023/m.136270 type:complete len:524 (-) Transcript_58023:284-1855(-)
MATSRLAMSRYGSNLLSSKESRAPPRSQSVMAGESGGRSPFMWDRSLSDTYASDRIVNKPYQHSAHFVAGTASSKRVSLLDVIDAERNYLFGNNGPAHRPGTSHHDEMSRYGSRLVGPRTEATQQSLRKNALEFTRQKENVSWNNQKESVGTRRGSIKKGFRFDTFTLSEPKADLFEISKNTSPTARDSRMGREFTAPRKGATSPPIHPPAPPDTAAQPSASAAPQPEKAEQQPPKMQDMPAIATIDTAALYNIVVDGTVGHLILDTRHQERYDDCHVRGAVDLAEALTYQGRHLILVGPSSGIGDAEQHAIRRLQRSERALSYKILEGGFNAFKKEYPFFCEQSAASRDEEFKRLRERRLHIYPSQALPYLYIGGLESAQDPQVHSDLKIRHVISILADPNRVRPPDAMSRQLKLKLRDEEDEDIEGVFEQAQAFLAQSVADGGNVLIHCKMGRSRSATLVLMWMVHHHRMTLAAAWRKLKGCRRQIGLNSGFTRTLIDFEKRTTGTSTVTWSSTDGLRLIG